MKKYIKRNFLFLISILFWIIAWNLPQNFYIAKGILCIIGFFAVILYSDYDPYSKIPTGF